MKQSTGKGKTNKSFIENRQHIAALNLDFHHSIIQEEEVETEEDASIRQ